MSNNYSHTSTTVECKDTELNIAIIGGGLTGLITADLLENTFRQNQTPIKIVIFEKSAGVGRLATRYKKPMRSSLEDKQWQFDFGAQFFTVKSTNFQSYLQPWLDKNVNESVIEPVIRPWYARIATIDATNEISTADMDIATSVTDITRWDDTQPRYVSCPKMTSLGRDIAKGLKHTTICYKTRVAPLIESASIEDHETFMPQPKLPQTKMPSTSLYDVDGNKLGAFDWVVCTAPQPQASELVANSGFEHMHAIAQHNMLACYTLMLGWCSPKALPKSLHSAKWDIINIEPSGAHDALSPLAKVFLEHRKPSRDAILPSITIHSSNLWAEQHVDDDIESVKTLLVASAQALLQWDETNHPDHIDCHRWRYAATRQETVKHRTQQAYCDNSKKWIVTGDWCIEGRIENCFEAASSVVRLITKDIIESLNI